MNFLIFSATVRTPVLARDYMEQHWVQHPDGNAISPQATLKLDLYS